MEYTITATNEMNELLVIGSTGQILQLTRRKHLAKGCSDVVVRKNDFRERLWLFRCSIIRDGYG